MEWVLVFVFHLCIKINFCLNNLLLGPEKKKLKADMVRFFL